MLMCLFVLEYATLAINISLLQHSHLKLDTLDSTYYPAQFFLVFFIHLRNSHFLQLYTVLSLVDIIISYS